MGITWRSQCRLGGAAQSHVVWCSPIMGLKMMLFKLLCNHSDDIYIALHKILLDSKSANGIEF